MPYRKPKQRSASRHWMHALSSLSPMQEEIVWTMVESGSEHLPMVVNMLRRKFPEVPNEALVADVEDAITSLWSAGLITFCRYERSPRRGWVDIPPEDAERFLSLRDVLSWDANEGYWRWDESRCDPDHIYLCLPEQVLKAFRIQHGLS